MGVTAGNRAQFHWAQQSTSKHDWTPDWGWTQPVSQCEDRHTVWRLFTAALFRTMMRRNERTQQAGKREAWTVLAVSGLLSRTVPALKLQYVFFSTREHSIKKETNRRLHGSCRYCKITIIAAENLRDVTPAGMFTDASFMWRWTTLADILPQSLTSSDVLATEHQMNCTVTLSKLKTFLYT